VPPTAMGFIMGVTCTGVQDLDLTLYRLSTRDTLLPRRDQNSKL
jgi:hypothetical protein